MKGTFHPDYVARTVLKTSKGIIAVLDPFKEKPWMWNFPGGKSEVCDGGLPRRTARRENFQETGIMIPLMDLHLVDVRPAHNHMRYLFEAEVSDSQLPNLLAKGDEGEVVRIIPYEDFHFRNPIADHYFHEYYRKWYLSFRPLPELART